MPTLIILILGLAAGYALAYLARVLLARRGLLAPPQAAAASAPAGEPPEAGGAKAAAPAWYAGQTRRRLAADSAAALLTAALFAFMHLRFGFSGAWAVGALLTALCVLITITDLAARIIPNGALLVFGVLLLAAVPFASPEPLWLHLLGAVCGSGILLLLAILSSGRGMGMGDVKLLAVLGWVLGLPGVLLALFFGSIIGLLAGLLQQASGGNKKRKTIPFGPYLAFGSLIVYMYGKEIIDWYLTNLIQH